MQQAVEGLCPGLKKFRALGAVCDADLDAFWKLVKVRAGIRRGETIASTMRSDKHFTMLLDGLLSDKQIGSDLFVQASPNDVLHDFAFPR